MRRLLLALMRPLAAAALAVGWPMALAAAALMAALGLAFRPLLAGWQEAWSQASALTVVYALAIGAWALAEYALLVTLVVAVALNARRRRR